MSRKHSDASLLAAAREVVAETGVRRTTVSDVARRAGASRMTVYRAFPDGPTLWSTLFTEILAEIIRGAESDAASLPSARLRFVETAVRAAQAAVRNPVISRLLEDDPDLVLPYLMSNTSPSRRAMLAIIRRYIDEGKIDRSIRDIDPDSAAQSLSVVVLAFVMSAQATENEVGLGSAWNELRSMIDAYLRPGYDA